jgi:hypothetical protein
MAYTVKACEMKEVERMYQPKANRFLNPHASLLSPKPLIA